jgi:hypothetical protein
MATHHSVPLEMQRIEKEWVGVQREDSEKALAIWHWLKYHMSGIQSDKSCKMESLPATLTKGCFCLMLSQLNKGKKGP